MIDAPVWAQVDDWVSAQLLPADEVLAASLAACEAAGLPAIQVSAPQGKLLHLLARMNGARRVLEVGTLGGYSAIWLARAVPAGGHVVTLELDPKHAAVARANFVRAGLQDVIELRQGPALASLEQLHAEGAEPFDFVFIDADKPGNPFYIEWALRLTKPGSAIVLDNVVREGNIVDAASQDPAVIGARRAIELLAAHPRVSATVVQTVGVKGYDGFVLALVVA